MKLSAPASDSDLLRRCQARDERAWDTLLQRYERLVYSVPLRCGLSEEDAADVFQFVCVQLLNNLEKVRGEDHLTAWLITLAKRESWRLLRVRSRQVEWPEDDRELGIEGGNGAAEGALPEEALLQLERQQLVRRGLEQMDGRCRTLLEALYSTDPMPSYDQVAALTGIPRGSLGPTRARCLEKLKRILQRMDF